MDDVLSSVNATVQNTIKTALSNFIEARIKIQLKREDAD